MSTILLFGRVLHKTCSKLPNSNVNANMVSLGIRFPFDAPFLNQTRCYAARKGTREKRRKIKAAQKLKEIKKELAPVERRFGLKAKAKALERTPLFHPTREPVDDVWIHNFNKRKIYPILEAIKMHRELHHPTMMDSPDAPLYLKLELDMSLEKKTKFLDAFSGIVANPHYFSDGRSRTILAFSKNDQGQSDALAAGASVAGGISLIKQVRTGEVIASEFDYIVSHTDIMNDLTPIRGILKKNYPTAARGCLGVDMFPLVEKFKMGIQYRVEKDSVQHNFGFAEMNIGPLSMPAEHIEANIGAVVEAVCKQRLARLGPFISLAVLFSPATKEIHGIDVSKYMPAAPEEEDDDEEESGAIQQ